MNAANAFSAMPEPYFARPAHGLAGIKAMATHHPKARTVKAAGLFIFPLSRVA